MWQNMSLKLISYIEKLSMKNSIYHLVILIVTHVNRDELQIAIPNASPPNKQNELHWQLCEHQLKASHGYEALRDDTEKAKSDTDLLVITFDLQQNLHVPTLTHSSMFYLHQVWVYNFGIHDCGTGSATMCIWNGTIAGRGAHEIISCLLHYLHQLRSKVTFARIRILPWFVSGILSLYRRCLTKLIINFLFVATLIYQMIATLKKRRHLLKCMCLTNGENVIASCRQSNPFQIQHDIQSLLWFWRLGKAIYMA